MISEQPTPNAEAPPAPAAKKKIVRRKKRPARVAAKAKVNAAARVEPAAEPFPGLTKFGCASACREGHCEVSGAATCGHPFKSSIAGLPPDAVARRHAALKQIEHQRVEAVR